MGISRSRLCRGAIIFHGGKKVNKNGRGGKVAPNGYKILSIVLAALLAAVAVVELVLWRLDYIVFQNPNAQEQTVGTQDSLIIGESQGNGVEIRSAKIAPENYAEYGVSALAETAYTLTATVEPEEATNKTILFSTAFKDPGSSWASGKNVEDYVTISKTTVASGENISVSCLQAFGEQIVVKACAEEDSAIYAECTVDYVKKVNGMELTLKKGDEVATAFDIYRTLTMYSFIPTIQWSDGTVEYDSVNFSIDIFANYDLVDAFDAEGISMRPSPSNQVDHQPFNDPDNGAYKYDIGYMQLIRLYGVGTTSRDQFFEELSSWDGALFDLKIYVEAYFVDGGKTEEALGDFYCDESVSIHYYAQEFDIGVGTVDVGVSATDVTLDQSAIVM